MERKEQIEDIISDITSGINSILENSLKKILDRENLVNNCLFQLPQVKEIISLNDALILKNKELYDKNNKLQIELNTLNYKYRDLLLKSNNSIKNISLNVEEKNKEPSNVIEELKKVESNTNKVVTINYINNMLANSSDETSSDESSSVYDDDAVEIADYWKKEIAELNKNQFETTLNDDNPEEKNDKIVKIILNSENDEKEPRIDTEIEEKKNEEEDEEDEEEDIELDEKLIKMNIEFIKKHNLKPKYHTPKTATINLVNCYIDYEGIVYKIEDDEEVGDILGNFKDGIFFEC